MTRDLKQRYEWFRRNSGMGAEQCLELARAESWFLEHEWTEDGEPRGRPDYDGALRFVWEQDRDYDPNDYDCGDMPDIGWGGILQEWCSRCNHWNTLQSLWSVTFDGDGHPDGNYYARIVRAMLCLEAIPDPAAA